MKVRHLQIATQTLAFHAAMLVAASPVFASRDAQSVRSPGQARSADRFGLEVRARFIEERPASAPAPRSEAERRLEQLGRLVHSEIFLEAQDAPLREVLRSLRTSIGVNLVTFELDPTGRSDRDGVDPEQPITLSLSGVSGRSALEAIASLVGPGVTWQLTLDRIEFGPKSVLARVEARRTEVYETTDLALDPPDWKNPMSEAPGKTSYNRRDSDEIIGELVRNIAANCEPEAFFAPPPPMVETSDGRRLPAQHVTPAGPASGGPPPGSGGYSSPRRRPNTLATVNYDPAEAVVFIVGQWASIQAKDNNLSVLAPDFVHRAIGGYPPAPPPRAAASP